MSRNILFYKLNYYLLKYIDYENWHKLIFKINSLRYDGQYYKINFKNPSTFNEKLIFLKRKNQPKIYSTVADKFKVREYIKQTLGEKYLIPLIWSSTNIKEFNQSLITNNCVLKLNNGSGKNFIIRSSLTKKEFAKIKKTFSKLLKMDFSLYSRESHYKNIKPRILIEKILDFPLNDYKFFCSKGEPFMIQVDINRFTNHQRNFYDINWKKQNITLNYKNYKGEISRPKQFNLMIEISKKLSKQFEFCRIDLYESRGNVYFGEITLFPGGGVELFKSYYMDLKMGDFINLKNYE